MSRKGVEGEEELRRYTTLRRTRRMWWPGRGTGWRGREEEEEW